MSKGFHKCWYISFGSLRKHRLPIVKYEGMKSRAAWNALKNCNKWNKILTVVWIELGVFISADTVMKSSSSRRTWHYKPYFLCQPVPFSRCTRIRSSVTMREVICIPEWRCTKLLVVVSCSHGSLGQIFKWWWYNLKNILYWSLQFKNVHHGCA